MRKIILLVVVCAGLSAGCSKKEEQDTTPTTVSLIIADIPHDCVPFYSGDGRRAVGNHYFPLYDQLFMAVGFDCGIREGKKCSYYLALMLDHGQLVEDTRCE